MGGPPLLAVKVTAHSQWAGTHPDGDANSCEGSEVELSSAIPSFGTDIFQRSGYAAPVVGRDLHGPALRRARRIRYAGKYHYHNSAFGPPHTRAFQRNSTV